MSTCPELGVASQGKTRKEAYAMLAEAVEQTLAGSHQRQGNQATAEASVVCLKYLDISASDLFPPRLSASRLDSF